MKFKIGDHIVDRLPYWKNPLIHSIEIVDFYSVDYMFKLTDIKGGVSFEEWHIKIIDDLYIIDKEWQIEQAIGQMLELEGGANEV